MHSLDSLTSSTAVPPTPWLFISSLVRGRRREKQQASVCLKEVREEAIAVQLVLAPMTDTQLPRLLLVYGTITGEKLGNQWQGKDG